MNIADKLTFFRLYAVPFFVLFFSIDTGNPGLSGDYLKIAAAVLFILGAISDGMDGYYARKYKIVTSSGKLWDPVADKILVSSALILLTSYDYIPAYVVILIIAREFFISGVRLVSIERGNLMSASKLGKWKTGFQLGYIITILVFICFEILIIDYCSGNYYSDLFLTNKIYIIKTLEIITVFFTVFSGYNYFKQNRENL
ncbi:MAG: CDP-diacylglycerol--glycerol-3-phosphate 3-phosphatidyltransferase [Candidatus Muiribacteriota bacterium]